MTERESQIFIDIQGFSCSFGYIPKELAIYDGIRYSNFLFKPPFKKNMLSAEDCKIVSWAEEYHGMEWEFGNINLNEVEIILRKIYETCDNAKFYVKGNEKGLFLRKFFDEEMIINIPIRSEPKLSNYKKIPECYFHKNINPWHCALANVKLLYNYKNCY